MKINITAVAHLAKTAFLAILPWVVLIPFEELVFGWAQRTIIHFFSFDQNLDMVGYNFPV
jgi:hypothetical protein